MPGVIAEAMRTELTSLTEGQAYKRTTAGFLDAVRSPVNGGTQIRVDQGQGKTRIQKIKYMPKKASTVTSVRPADCEQADDNGYVTDTVELSLNTVNGFKIQQEYVRQIEEGNNKYLMDQLTLKWDETLRDINDKVQTVAATSFGINQATGASTARTINILNAGADNASRVSGYYDFTSADLRQANYFNGQPIVVAQGNFDRFAMNQGWACCNDNGFDLSTIGAQSVAYFRDQQVEDTLGANQAFVWEPGSVKWLTYHKYAHVRGADSVFQQGGAYGAFVNSDGWETGIIMDPRTGLIYDMIVKPDQCAGVYHVTFELCFDVYVMPTDQVAAGDKLEGTNGFYRYLFAAS